MKYTLMENYFIYENLLVESFHSSHKILVCTLWTYFMEKIEMKDFDYWQTELTRA